MLSVTYGQTLTTEKLRSVGRERTLGCLLHYFLKSYINVFLFVGLTTLGTFIEFCLVSSFSCTNVLTTKWNTVIVSDCL